MTYALAERPFYVADSHIMELPNFLIDYPHVEGGRDPIGRFESSLGSRTDAVRENFYAENFLKIFAGARVHDKLSV
jgi:hypothetical protein